MKAGAKRLLSVFLVLLLLILSGCVQNVPAEETSSRKKAFDIPDNITLRVIVDPYWEQIETYINSVVKSFTAVYDNVTIEVETLEVKNVHNWDNERKNNVNTVQNQIDAGIGPDIFILSTNTYDDGLFPDLNVAMREGHFADLNEYYMTDSELNREELVTEVMEAGIVGDARYLLPMAYQYCVAYVDPDRLYQVGLDSSIFDSGIISLLDAVCRLGDSDVAAAVSALKFPAFIRFMFPNILDYDTGQVRLTSEELTEFLELIQEYKSLCSGAPCESGNIEAYYNGTHWWQNGSCMNLNTLQEVTEQFGAAKALEVDLQMYPLSAANGKLAAEIEWLGAVNANCEYPEAAYEFLRMFLLPEAIENDFFPSGYPVRAHGYVSTVYQNNYKNAVQKINISSPAQKSDAAIERLDALNGIEVTDSDLPFLQNTIDVAQSTPVKLKDELFSIISQLNDPETGQPTDVDIEKLAQGYIDYLTVYLKGQLGTE